MRVYILTMDFKKFFAKRLKDARLAKGLTQGRLTQMCDLPSNAITKYETGVVTPSVESLKKLAEALEVSTDYFVFDHAKMDGIPKISDPTLYERYFVLETLGEADRDTALSLLDALIARQRLRELVTTPEAKKPHKTAHA